MTDPKLRPAVRALMIDPADCVLMVKLDFVTGWVGWVLPGGGIEKGEDPVTALRRELLEETGAAEIFVGPPVCRRRHISPGVIEGYDGQEETIYLVPTHGFEVEPAMSVEELRAEGVVGARWWTLAELAATAEIFVPENLVELTQRILDDGAPEVPVMLEQIDEV